MNKILISIGIVIISSISLAENVAKDVWISEMQRVLPRIFCTTDQYFRQCFNVQESQCQMVISDATNICLLTFQDQIPAQLEQPVDGTYWGSQVGMCVGNAYELTLINQKINTATCNDPANWQ